MDTHCESFSHGNKIVSLTKAGVYLIQSVRLVTYFEVSVRLVWCAAEWAIFTLTTFDQGSHSLEKSLNFRGSP